MVWNYFFDDGGGYDGALSNDVSKLERDIRRIKACFMDICKEEIEKERAKDGVSLLKKFISCVSAQEIRIRILASDKISLEDVKTGERIEIIVST